MIIMFINIVMVIVLFFTIIWFFLWKKEHVGHHAGHHAMKVGSEHAESHNHEHELHGLQRKLIISIALYVPILLGTIMPTFFPWLMSEWFFLVLATPIQFWVGSYLYQSTWRSFINHSANMNTLIALGTSVAYFYSVFVLFFQSLFVRAGIPAHMYFDVSAGLITIIFLGNYLEAHAKGVASKAIEKLLTLAPKKATKLIKDAQGEQQWQEVTLDRVDKEDILLIKPGDSIPVDGVVIEGESLVDESMVTGESVPVIKHVNSKVTGGTINKRGSFQMRATKVGSETLLAKIIDLVKRAQSSKAPIAKIVDRISAIFVPVVIIASILTFLIWFNVGPEPRLLYALVSLVSVLIIACPCALGLATPTSIMVGIGRAAQEGILIKDAQTLQMAGKISVIVLDKTGTLTKGAPELIHISFAEHIDKEMQTNILRMIVSLEERSRHPISDAVIRTFGQEYKNMKLQSFETMEGLGLKGQIEGHTVHVGSRRFLEQESAVINTTLDRQATSWLNDGHSVTYVALDKKNVVVFSVIDPIKKDAFDVIVRLNSMGISTVMLTGDTPEIAKIVAQKLGIKTFVAQILPPDKLKYIAQLQRKGKLVAMVGDGINDAPALAESDVGIAMGEGTDVAIETAAVTLLKSDIALVPKVITLSRATMRNIYQNLFWAFGYNVILIPVAMGVLYPVWGILLNPLLAGFAMTFSSLSVVVNALRLKTIAFK